jgi:hypothetical protein
VMTKIKSAKPLLVYVACPSRLMGRMDEFQEVVVRYGHAPLNPFAAFPYPLFEGGRPGRDQTLEWCCRLIDISDKVWLFGVSAGTLFEIRYLLGKGRRKDLWNLTSKYDGEIAAESSELARILGEPSGFEPGN